ncbi:hypothetical protein [Mycobacterium lepromatosis]
MAGSAFAHGFHRTGCTPTVIEQEPKFRTWRLCYRLL